MRKISYKDFAEEALISDIELIVTREEHIYFTTGIINNKYFALTRVDDVEIIMLDNIDIESQLNLEELKNSIKDCTELELHFPKWLKGIKKAYLSDLVDLG